MENFLGLRTWPFVLVSALTRGWPRASYSHSLLGGSSSLKQVGVPSGYCVSRKGSLAFHSHWNCQLHAWIAVNIFTNGFFLAILFISISSWFNLFPSPIVVLHSSLQYYFYCIDSVLNENIYYLPIPKCWNTKDINFTFQKLFPVIFHYSYI